MADGEQQLPADEELFEPMEQSEMVNEPVAQEPAAEEPMQVDEQAPEPEQLHVENGQGGEEPERIPEAEVPAEVIQPAEPVPVHQDLEPIQHDNDDYNAYDHHGKNDEMFDELDREDSIPPPAADVFHPEGPAPDFFPEGGNAAPGQFDMHEANEHTVWIDSDSDDDTEDIILRQNFYLPYSDHNYDPPDPKDRVEQPDEGPFPIIDGLDADGRITKQWMPGEEGDPNLPQAAESSTSPSQISLHTNNARPLPQRPTAHAPPFSVGGSQVEYAQAQRGAHPMARGDGSHFRAINDPFNGSNARQMRHGAPAVIVRGPVRDTYVGQPFQQGVVGPLRGPIHPQRRVAPQHMQASTPGSYQNIQATTPGQGVRRGNQIITNIPRLMPSGRQGPVVRPIQMSRQIENPEREREFVDQQQQQQHPNVPPTAQVLPQRRTIDPAPHRMTQEQREQQARRAQPAMYNVDQPPGLQPQMRGGPRNVLLRGAPSSAVAGSGVVVNRGRGPEVLRSPQRPVVEAPPPAPVVVEHSSPPQKPFQLKVTTTSTSYSAAAPPKNSELPAQITEDPPEDEPTTSNDVAETAQPSESVEDLAAPLQAEQPIRQMSPMKPHGISKALPPHRLTEDEKTAHLARLAADKDKPAIQPVQHIPLQHEPPTPIPVRHSHQDDALAMVQSVFDNSKPRLPDTPKDKEAISKIADHLRFSAEKYEIGSGSKTPNQHAVDPHRRRHDSGMSGSSSQHYHQNPHQHQQHPGMMDMDEARRKRISSGSRYDIPLNMPPQQQAPVPLRPGPNAMDQPHRPRGRPRGSTGPQRNRYPSGQEPIAPHRIGGARTLPPRNQQHQPPPAQKNSDSEGSGINEDGDSEDWVMRCRCGMDHPVGDTIECEKCKEWQHALCMDVDTSRATEGYMCEQCQPRTIPISKSEAIRRQKKELARIAKENEALEKKNKNKRKSEPAAAEQKKASTSSSRKSMPAAFHAEQQPQQRQRTKNEYSKQAALLLSTMMQTAGADTLLEESAEMARAKRMYVSENIEALVTTQVVNQRAVVLEVQGHVSLVNEIKRRPGGGGFIFMYDGLMKGTAGEDMGDGHELICVDARKKGNDSKYTRRSCDPNCVLKHVLGSKATLGVMIVATKEIPYNNEVTLPFDMDWRMCDQQLECAEHLHNMELCPFEVQRRMSYNDRNRDKRAREEARKKLLEEERRQLEENRRMEEEVRQERAARQKQLEEEEKEQERLENERRAKEREEARKKKKEAKEAEKREREAREASEAAKLPPPPPPPKEKVKEEQAPAPATTPKPAAAPKPAATPKPPAATPEAPHRMTREERMIQQAEERFRRQEEEQKRKAAKAVKDAEREKSGEAARQSATPNPDAPGTSAAALAERTPSVRRSGRRLDSTTSDRTVSPPPKRAKSVATPVARAPEKRSAPKSNSNTPAPKRQKESATRQADSGLVTCRQLQDIMHQSALKATNARSFFTLPFDDNIPVSQWVQNMKEPDRTEDDKAMAEKRKKLQKLKKKNSENAKKPKASTESSSKTVEKKDEKKEGKKDEKKAEKPVEVKVEVVEKKEEKKEEKKAEKPAAPPKEAEKPVEVKKKPPPPQQKAPEEIKKEREDEVVVKQEIVEKDTQGTSEAVGSTSEAVQEAGEPTKKEEKKAPPKRLSLSDYKKRKEVAGPSTSTPSAARQGSSFIPSTAGSSNVRLSDISLEMGGIPPIPPPPPEDEVEDNADHQQPLSLRAATILPFLSKPAPSTASAPPPPPPPPTQSTPSTSSSSRHYSNGRHHDSSSASRSSRHRNTRWQ